MKEARRNMGREKELTCVALKVGEGFMSHEVWSPGIRTVQAQAVP